MITKNKYSYRSIWLSNATSELGGAFFTACNSILAYELTGSAASLGLIWLLYYIPSFFMQLFIGPYIDRYSRKSIMINCQIVRMLLAILLVSSLLLNHFSIAFIYAIQIINGMIMPIFIPANQAILPTILEKDQLAKANASLDSIRQIMIISGAVLTGVFLDYLAIEWIVVMMALAFFTSTIALMKLKENKVRAFVRRRWIDEFKEGLQTYFNHKLIVLLGVFFGFVQFGVGVTIVTTLPYITTILNQSYSAYGLFMAGFPIGYIIGALLNKKIGEKIGVGKLFIALFIGGGTYISLSLTTIYGIAVLTEFLAGVVIAIFNIYNITLIQRSIPNYLLGKVTSVRLLIMRTMLPLGILFATITTPFITIRMLYFIIGFVICLTSLIGYFYLNKQTITQSSLQRQSK